MDLQHTLTIATTIVHNARKRLLKIVESGDLQAVKKEDNSFVTRADKETEDYIRKQLASTFLRICSRSNRGGPLPFHAVFADKRTNMAGLQIADLAAYPIARKIIEPDKNNPAYEKVEARLRRSPNGRIRGWGLKVFP